MTLRQLAPKSTLIGVLAVGAVVGLLSAGLATGKLSLWPPSLGASKLGVAAAQTHVLVDTPAPSMLQRRALEQDLTTLVKHTELLGRVMVSPEVLDRIAADAGLRSGSVGGTARITTSVPQSLLEPGSEQRATDIAQSELSYSVEAQARPESPVIDVYTRAPSAAEAERLANAAVSGLRGYLNELAAEQGLGDEGPLVLRQLGEARGSAVDRAAPMAIGLLAFCIGVGLSCGALLLLLWLSGSRRLATTPRSAGPAQLPEGDDDWPHTTRLLPWALAGFVAILWLVPFNVIKVNASLPIDLTLDRLLLPLVAVVWILAFAGGGPTAPRVRFTPIHAAIGVFVFLAFLSVLLDAGYLGKTLELELAFKKLPLLLSLVSLFLITASALRPSEVPAFLSYTLILAVLCAVGIIIEYRFEYNLFYEWSAKLLPPAAFVVGEFDPTALDSLGRRVVLGPGEAGLEAVAMLTMALPIGLVGLLQSKTWRARIVYSLAVCVLVSATFATYRKSAVVAPIAVVLTLACFRRHELLKLAPIGMLLVVLVTALAPGALRATVNQFLRSDRLDVPTVSDRSSDYDAVRPDLWTNLILGRGWGSYNHETYRILDSEILHRTLEMGLVGLLAFLIMVLSVILSARKTIARRDPQRAPIALVGASAAAAFLILSTLFDILSFPHATMIFLYTAGLVALVIAHREEEDEVPETLPAGQVHEEGRVHEGHMRRTPAVRRLTATLSRGAE